MTKEQIPSKRIIRLPAAIELVGLGRTAIYDRIKEGSFPKPVKLGRASGWVESEIQAWIEARMKEREE